MVEMKILLHSNEKLPFICYEFMQHQMQTA